MAAMASSTFTLNFPKIKFNECTFLGYVSSFFPMENCKRAQKWPNSNTKMQIGRPNNFKNTSLNNNNKKKKIYKRFGSCLVIPPPKGKKPKAIVKFLGGAFIGAVPEVSYSYLLEQLASEGYFIISVPYNVTFDHEKVTGEIYERFHACYDMILASGLPEFGLSVSDVVDLPLYSVGHSNGALLQVLTGSYFCDKIPKANAIISYNNRPASEAVPYFEQLGPLVSQIIPVMESSPIYSFARNASDDRIEYMSLQVVMEILRTCIQKEEVWKLLLDTAGTVIPDYDAEVTVSVTKFADQLPSVFNQLAQGISEFKPTPSQNLDCFQKSYNVQHTLLVRFNFDAIDETDLLEETLKPRVESIGGKLQRVVLSGTHVTPCIQEPRWQVGDIYTAVDAIAQGLKKISLNDTRVLGKTIADWFNQLED